MTMITHPAPANISATAGEASAIESGVPWYIWAVAFASTSVLVGVVWDISWHRTIGRDTKTFDHDRVGLGHLPTGPPRYPNSLGRRQAGDSVVSSSFSSNCVNRTCLSENRATMSSSPPMFRPRFPTLSHPGLQQAIPSIAFIAQVYRADQTRRFPKISEEGDRSTAIDASTRKATSTKTWRRPWSSGLTSHTRRGVRTFLFLLALRNHFQLK